ncbi:class I SAM-dependent methyltransferase [Acetobacterium tundrae]|uniref:Methyltransferase domain-containing protein n=1 Tax=Acetobacterium tundrae TaxID=132932 RepID=A0ABR6WNK1_9FIRM|nr:class I SAM-dependent methyltransferase [Acetobacterium tundrae]MBC3798069.1 methyltransferase domain-containing protein [Acetobacterium tundrae]
MEADVFYQNNAKVYDILDRTYFRKPATSPRNAVISAIGNESLTVLDLCTGTGSNAIALARAKRKVSLVGIDISGAMLERAAIKLKQAGVTTVELMQMDAANLQFPNGKFDVVLISLVLHEIKTELAGQMIAEARRVLKTDGKLMILEWEEPVNWLQKIAFYLVKKTEPKGFEDFLKCDQDQYFARYGFQITQTIHCDYSKVMILAKNEQRKLGDDMDKNMQI